MGRIRLGTILSITAMSAACAGETTPTPVAPTVAVTSVTVSSAPTSGVAVLQLVATARLADGTARDVTTIATWESSNPSLATISSTGVVMILGSGAVDARATYQNVTGSMHLQVSVARVALQGVVRDVPPGNRPLAGVRLDVIDGPDLGKVALSDQAGVYRFDALSAGRMSMRATKDGYQSWAIGNLLLTADGPVQMQDVWLFPVPPRDAGGAPPTARCNDGAWTWASDPKIGCADHGGIAYQLAPGTDKPLRR